MRGRKPHPTALKILTGNLGKRPLNKQEPQAPVEVPDMPPHLDEEAQAEWGRISVALHMLRIIARIDRAALAGYCQAYSRWVKAEDILKKTGEVLRSADTGNFYRNPWLDVANRALRQMKEFLIEFGMTPSSRVRLKVAPLDSSSDFNKDIARLG